MLDCSTVESYLNDDPYSDDLESVFGNFMDFWNGKLAVQQHEPAQNTIDKITSRDLVGHEDWWAGH